MTLRISVIVLAVAGCSGEGGGRCGPSSAVVSAVVDGDTVDLEDGTRVRYLMVDSPEIGTAAECFGPEAAQFNRDLVLGKTVSLAYDVECEDRFGRLLAYVSVGGREVNALLVERGYACVLYIPPNGEDRRTEFLDLQTRAQAELRGLWGACQESPCGN